ASGAECAVPGSGDPAVSRERPACWANRLGRLAITFCLCLGASEAVPAAGDGSAESMTDFGLRVDRIAWLQDHMEHGGGIQMPPSMTPDLPVHGYHRLSVAITVYNRGVERQAFRVAELELRSRTGHRWRSTSPAPDPLTLASGQLAHLSLQYDVSEAEDHGLYLVWRRGDREQAMSPVSPALGRSGHRQAHGHRHQ
ncbi:MAG: hypothetical protein ACREWG_17440, partial [Gammaproteobacteria bacterium]